MQGLIKRYETNSNIYYIGYGRSAKTTYEQQQDRRAELLYMTFQKALGLILTALSIIMLAYGIIPAVLPLIMGIAVVLTKDHVIG